MQDTRAIKSNQELWDNFVKVHVNSEFYDVPRFLKGKCSLDEIQLELLGNVKGKSVLHLQCHFGQDTLSLARMGARVTGVDFSRVAIETARDFNAQLQLNAKFIQSDVNQLDKFLDGEFDIVYASYGVIGWHSDLEKWARIVSRFMKKGARFCFAEFHPVFWMLDDDHSAIGYSYFKSDTIINEDQRSYAEPAAGRLGTSYCWNHSLSELFQALESHGLTIRKFKEYDYLPYRTFQDITEKKGRYYVRGLEHKLPLVYSLIASK
jgi:ubiquinone/menaquinone biosynthesis C-methylase UbiE